MFPIPRLYRAGIGLALILALAGGLYLRGRHDAAEKAKARVEASQQAQRQAEVTTQALDQHTQRTVIIRERADAAVQIVQAAPGAGDPISPDVLSAWRSGLRDNPASDTRDSPAGSTGTLPPT